MFRCRLDLIFETYGERGIGSFRRRCAFEEEDREANYAHSIISTVLITLAATPLTVSAQSGSGAVPGAVGGAAAGAAIGGPVGAAVGGVAGAAVGGALTADQSTKVKAYVTKEKRSSVKVTEKVAVGEPYRPPSSSMPFLRTRECRPNIATPS